jgi:hypothetical protein
MGIGELQRSTRTTDEFASTIGTAIFEFTTAVRAERAFKAANHGNAIGGKQRFTPFAGLTHLKHQSSLPYSVILDHLSIRWIHTRQRLNLCLVSIS